MRLEDEVGERGRRGEWRGKEKERRESVRGRERRKNIDASIRAG